MLFVPTDFYSYRLNIFFNGLTQSGWLSPATKNKDRYLYINILWILSMYTVRKYPLNVLYMTVKFTLAIICLLFSLLIKLTSISDVFARPNNSEIVVFFILHCCVY